MSIDRKLLLHIRILKEPDRHSVDEMIDRMKQIYASAGIRVIVVSIERINLPQLEDIDIGFCEREITTNEQNELFSHRNNASQTDIVSYFVRTTNPFMNGCSSHPDGKPGCIVASIGSVWTLAHEVAHVLDLEHVNNRNRLMYGRGTDNITNPPPDLTIEEINDMKNSRLLLNL